MKTWRRFFGNFLILLGGIMPLVNVTGVAGGGASGPWTFIERFSPGANVASFTFGTALNGNVDQIYMVEGNFRLVPIAGTVTMSLALDVNGAGSGSMRGECRGFINAGAFGNNGDSIITYDPFGVNDVFHFHLIFWAQTNVLSTGPSPGRQALSVAAGYMTDAGAVTEYAEFTAGVFYLDMVTNVTSMGFRGEDRFSANNPNIVAGSIFDLYRLTHA